MPSDQSRDPGLDEDRVVSRRVDHPTEATEEDARSYPGAPDRPQPNEPAAEGAGTTERADHDLAEESDEPTRSE
jgi:hypothetical protein